MTMRGFYITLALVTAAVLLLAGCASSINGGSSRKAESSTLTTTGQQHAEQQTTTSKATAATTADARDTFIQTNPDGTIIVRIGHKTATTQPATERTESRAVATSQPSTTQTTTSEESKQQPTATSTSGLPRFRYDKDGNIVGISIEANKVAERFKAVWWQSMLLVAGGGFLVWRGKWGIGSCMILGGFALAAYPELAVWAVVIGGVVVIFHLWSAHRQTADSYDHALKQAMADGVITPDEAKQLQAYAAEKQDGWLQKLLGKAV